MVLTKEYRICMPLTVEEVRFVHKLKLFFERKQKLEFFIWMLDTFSNVSKINEKNGCKISVKITRSNNHIQFNNLIKA